MTGRLEGTVALITGGARGQGRAHAIRMAEEGADIVVTDLCEQLPFVPYAMGTREELDETLAEVEKRDRRCLAITADARDSAQMHDAIARTVNEFGRLDTLVVNHGIGLPHPVEEEASDEIFDAVVETNLTAVWRTVRAAIPHMKERGGAIIVTASAGGLVPLLGQPGYVAAKHGLIGLVKALAAELAPYWIRVNAVCPTCVATPMLHNQAIQTLFSGGKPDATVADIVFPAQAMNLLPVPWIEPEAVSHAMVYLASDEAKYVTGIALPIDAGMSNQPPGITPYIGQHLADAAS
ncbi:(+)-trans-carveol dehydrogenase [Geodermatophilus africanus]|uniref:(+)-trans-carveol dehydrogenase n=1 Tax=Geodermatophilus africanus TaxID=1137993 RepID=A0A1H3QK61_9ACTN|nr:mycofactocin-coupled SDR family oxidoreductase [Geodermatophilus africanus]SDZ13365.1 (+)-trans-carveol dehydrogenase [Geodermatophilus africanus]